MLHDFLNDFIVFKIILIIKVWRISFIEKVQFVEIPLRETNKMS